VEKGLRAGKIAGDRELSKGDDTIPWLVSPTELSSHRVMPDSAHPPDTHDIDERVKALEEYVRANPPAALPTSASSTHVGYTGGIVVKFPHTHIHLSYPQTVGIVAGTIAMAGAILLVLKRPGKPRR
jgi:hypothetical protein